MKKNVFSKLIFGFTFCITALSISGLGFTQSVVTNASVDLFAGQTIDAGNVEFSIDEVNGENCLLVTFMTDWQIEEAHLWVGNSLINMPQTKKGNPKVGNFPYKYPSEEPTTFSAMSISGSSNVTFNVPLDTIGFICPSDQEFIVAAHAALNQLDGDGNVLSSETAWSAGVPIVQSAQGRGSWATMTAITLSCGDGSLNQQEEGSSETAFAHSESLGTCFLEIDDDGDGVGDFNRWGWTIGPITESEDTYTFQLYAGAGQCDTNVGLIVGTLTIDYSDGEVVATYNIDNGFTLEEAQFYAGSKILPEITNGNGKKTEFTVAPGQYPYIADPVDSKSGHTFTANNLSGEIYIVAHATVFVPSMTE